MWHWIKVVLVTGGTFALFRFFTGSWWMALLVVLFYFGKGVWEGLQEDRQQQQARTYEPMSSEEARIVLRRERWRSPQ